MDIIDFHTHVFPEILAPRAISELVRAVPEMVNVLDGTRFALRQSMRKCGVAVSVTLPVATKPTQVGPICADAIQNNSSDLVSFASLHPQNPDFISQIELLKAAGIKGVKLHPEYQNFDIDDPAMFSVYDALSQSGLIVLFHAGVDPGPFSNTHSTPDRISRISCRFPDLKIVAAHMGGYRMWDDVMRYLCGKNVYFDTSAVHDSMSGELFLKIRQSHGAEKILFGSDSPWFDQKFCIGWIDSLPITDGDKEQIFSRNSRTLLGIL